MAKQRMGIEIAGLKEMENTLKELPVQFKRNIYRKVMKDALRKEVLPEMKAETRKRFNDTVVKSLTVRNSKSKKNFFGAIITFTTDGFITRFFEFGTKLRFKRSTKAPTGKVNPDPYIERVHKKNIKPVIKYVNDNAGRLVEKFLKVELKKIRRKIDKLRSKQ